uniref:Fgenesh protein 43 n=1 Tax=Beta vulgaris TaxID=161934 RepID=Q20CD8_BETVU|nr:Fgenesh protein 43 [Beta vulgaris]
MDSYGDDFGGSGSEEILAPTPMTNLEFGATHVVRPKGKHQATIVWLHGMGDKGLSWSQLLETFPLPNIKWICPTAPTRPVALLGGFPCTSWFDVEDVSESVSDDLEGLDASAGHIANLLSSEPSDIKLGIGGFNIGAAIALYSVVCQVLGRYRNGNPYPINLSILVGLSGWLPCSSSLRTWMEESQEAQQRSASPPILLCHGLADEVVAHEHGERAMKTLASIGFENVTFRSYNGLGHYTIPEETEEVCKWLTTMLELEGNPSDP